MKYLAFIFSVYIFALNLAPCADFVSSADAMKSEISQTMDENHQHQNLDLCSPFCICQCCHVNATDVKFLNVKSTITKIFTQDFFYLYGAENNFSTSILYPPRV